VASIVHDFLPAEASLPSDRQRLFVLFFTGTLIDLVVLGLFAEYSDKVYVDSFTTTLLAAIVLQILLKVTIAAEHRVLAQFKGKTGAAWTVGKFFVAWVILFGSKFVILEALSFVFERDVHFEGILHGIVWLIIVVVTMVIIEELVVRFYRKIA
jgi:membrane protease YdiL (CAAX protease family)